METRVQPVSSFSNRLASWFRTLGPGIITAAIVFGPSKMTITSKMGASYGLSLVWVVVAAIYFMILFTDMAARIGGATNQSLLNTIRQKWGNTVAVIVGAGIFLVTASFQAGNSIGVGIAVGELTHTSTTLWIIFFNLAGIGLLFFRGFYKILEQIMIILVGLMLLAFLVTLFMIKPDVSHIASGLIPSVPPGSAGLIIAFTASCFSIVAAFYQSYLVQEKIRIRPEIKDKPHDSVSGIILLGVLVLIVMVCAGSVLHSRGIPVNSAMDMAKALEPLFGEYASILFLVGLFGASFSSLIGNATIGGTLLGDALGYGSRLTSTTIKYLIALIMLIGASIAIAFGKLPLQVIVLAQSVTIFIVPFIGIAMYNIANDKQLMGSRTNTPVQKIMGAVGLLIIITLAIINAKDLFS